MIFPRKFYYSAGEISQLSTWATYSKFISSNLVTKHIPKWTSGCRFLSTAFPSGGNKMPAEEKEKKIRQLVGEPRNAYAKIKMKDKIETLALQHLLDENMTLHHIFKRGSEEMCKGFWLLLLELSEENLATDLKEKLKKAGISEDQFSSSVAKVYFALDRPDYLHFDRGNSGQRDDIIRILDDMELDDPALQSIRILFSLLEEEEGSPRWRI